MKTKKKKINITNLIRRVIQILAFVFMPGLFISAFMSIKSVWTAVASGAFTASLYLPQLAIIFAVIPLTILFGRFFCGFLCSFGSMGDFMWKVARKLKIKPLKIGKKADGILKYIKYALLAFLVLFVWTLGAVAIDASVNPWNIFGMYTSLSGWSNLAGFVSLGGLFLLLIIVGSMFVERMFCRYFCPLGAVFALVSKLRIIKIRKQSVACGSCKACTKKCSMGIDMGRYDMVKSGECIDCFECVSVCPKNNAEVVISNQSVAPLAAGVMASAAIAGLYYAGSAFASSVAYAASDSNVVSIDTQGETGSFTDGTYTGSAEGYRGTTEVEVTVENGYITSVEVLSTDDDMDFFNMAKTSVINGILSSQCCEVDAVTGATYSSYAILNAVTDAIGGNSYYDMGENRGHGEMAAFETPANDTAEETATPDIADIEANADFSEVSDGTYSGTGSGFRGDIEVEVTVEGGKITDIEVVSHNEDGPYLDHALGVIDSIIAKQDVEVDAMSGATFSSNGIMEAVANALSVDFINENSTLPSEHGGGGGRRGGGGH